MLQLKSVFSKVQGSHLICSKNKLYVTTTAVDPRYKVFVFPDDIKCLTKQWIFSGTTQELEFQKKDGYDGIIATGQPTEASSTTCSCSSSPAIAYNSTNCSHFQSDIAKTFSSFCTYVKNNKEASPSKRKKTNNIPTDDQLNMEVNMLVAEKISTNWRKKKKCYCGGNPSILISQCQYLAKKLLVDSSIISVF